MAALKEQLKRMEQEINSMKVCVTSLSEIFWEYLYRGTPGWLIWILAQR
jgi:hypothetical protein